MLFRSQNLIKLQSFFFEGIFRGFSTFHCIFWSKSQIYLKTDSFYSCYPKETVCTEEIIWRYYCKVLALFEIFYHFLRLQHASSASIKLVKCNSIISVLLGWILWTDNLWNNYQFQFIDTSNYLRTQTLNCWDIITSTWL